MKVATPLASILLLVVLQAADAQPGKASGRWYARVRVVNSTPSPLRSDVEEIRVEHSGHPFGLNGFSARSSPVLPFGPLRHDHVGVHEIQWPGGIQQAPRNIRARQTAVIKELGGSPNHGQKGRFHI